MNVEDSRTASKLFRNSSIRFQFESPAPDAVSGFPGLEQFENAIKKKRTKQREQKKSQPLIQLKPQGSGIL